MKRSPKATTRVSEWLKKTPILPRKRPAQERSRAVVDAILGGAARILEQGGALDTNRVAKAAGVSIGTLYQYFPNKEAILGRLVEQFVDRKTGLVRQRIDEAASMSFERRVEVIIDALIERKRSDRLEDFILELFLRYADADTLRSVDERLVSVVREALAASREKTRPLDAELVAFVLVQATRGVLVAAKLERPELLHQTAFREELVRLVQGYLAPRVEHDRS